MTFGYLKYRVQTVAPSLELSLKVDWQRIWRLWSFFLKKKSVSPIWGS
jgi:hypothetical protein